MPRRKQSYERLSIASYSACRSGEGVDWAEKAAKDILSRSPRATELAKMMINAAEGEERDRVIEALAGTIAAGSDDLAIGLAAFREKRPPNFGDAT